MAYGLDVLDLIYTDKNLYDIGTLEDYIVDLDIAKEKNFELEIGASVDFKRRIRKIIGGKIDIGNDISQLDLLLPMHGYWYIEGTEFGGVIDKFKTDNDNYSLKYIGRSWRGILASKIFVCANSDSENVVGNLSDAINNILVRYDLDYLFVCDPISDLAETEERDVSFDAAHGATIYNIITDMADSVYMILRYKYSRRDKKVHITPDFMNDFTDEMTYDVDSSVNFSVEQDKTFVNHYILTSKNDQEKNRYTIHIFLDENKQYRPYLVAGVTEGTQIKDSQYILDTSQQVIKRTDEICEYIESSSTNAVTNYERLIEKPSDWDTNYKKYYTHKPTINETVDENDEDTPSSAEQTEVSGDSWSPVEMVTEDKYTLLDTQPPDWEFGYENYYTRSWSDSRTNITSKNVYIRFTPTLDETVVATDAYYEKITENERTGYFKVLNIDPNCNPKEKGYYEMEKLFSRDWLSETEGGPRLEPARNIVYIIQTFGDFYNDAYEWVINETEPEKTQYEASSKTNQHPEWTYSSVNGVSRTSEEGYETVEEQPLDWDLTFSNFKKRKVRVINGKEVVEWIAYSEEEADTEAIQIWSIDPETWKESYSDYYKRYAIPGYDKFYYRQYEGIPKAGQDYQYQEIPSKPEDWDEIYDQFYYKLEVDHGVPGKQSVVYEAYSSINEPNYVLTTSKPSDWETNFASYLVKNTTRTPTSLDDEYVSADIWQLKFDADAVGAYTKIEGSLIPTKEAWKEHYSEYYKKTTITIKTKTGKRTVDKYESYTGTEKTVKPIYKKIVTQPSDWKTNYDDYFYRVQTGRGWEYKQYESRGGKTTKKKLKKKPTMWSTEFGSYYEKKKVDGKKKFVNVEGKGSKNKAPKWKSGKYWMDVDVEAKRQWPDFGYIPNYKDAKGRKVKCDVYYDASPDAEEIPPALTNAVKKNLYLPTDGLPVYIIPGQTIYSDTWLSLIPNPKSKSDALKPVNKGTYTINSQGELFGITVYYNEKKKRYFTLAPTWVKDKFYYEGSTDKVPEFKPGITYYKIADEEMNPPEFLSDNCWKLEPKTLIPMFDPSNCYLTVTDTTFPEFKPNYYYSKSTVTGAPPFENETYYRRVFDHYKNMVDECLKKIKDTRSNDSQSVTLNDYELDVGDIVGGKDNVTGLYVSKTITNIVVKIDKGEVYLDYTMDDEGELSGEGEET